ncbi:hypothetical protein [Nocardia asteroides]|uniref:hypothetical protein n=1 Tax=Nocardia asteroides TaxID=1824 RepID=UPI001E3CBEF5|nr:hypothetical protein [Nocardia asteroides]UGT52376.1 hypothetical protein LTT85_16660 [Nocardia asteroides]
MVIARDASAVMEHLTLPDPDREWHQCFTPVDDSLFEGTRNGSSDCYLWVIQFYRHNWWGLLKHLEGLDWPDPYSVQVMIRDEEDHIFGMWMILDGCLKEIPLCRAERVPNSKLITGGVLIRTDAFGDVDA